MIDQKQKMTKAVLDIGARVQHLEGQVGTIRYIGPVCSSKDQNVKWIGIEWDSNEDGQSRGKHNGSVVDPSTVRESCHVPSVLAS